MTSPAAKVSDGTMTMALPGAAATVDTPGLPVRNKRLSIVASWPATGTPVGVFKLQCSFDAGANWDDVPGAAAEFTANGNLQPAGTAARVVWNFVNMPAGSWRIRYTGTSGTGTATLRFAWAG